MKPVAESEVDRDLRLLGIALSVRVAINANSSITPEALSDVVISSIRTVGVRGSPDDPSSSVETNPRSH